MGMVVSVGAPSVFAGAVSSNSMALGASSLPPASVPQPRVISSCDDAAASGQVHMRDDDLSSGTDLEQGITVLPPAASVALLFAEPSVLVCSSDSMASCPAVREVSFVSEPSSRCRCTRTSW